LPPKKPPRPPAPMIAIFIISPQLDDLIFAELA